MQIEKGLEAFASQNLSTSDLLPHKHDSSCQYEVRNSCKDRNFPDNIFETLLFEKNRIKGLIKRFRLFN